MARPLRLLAADATYHVTARGNGRMVIFGSDEDRRRFLEQLARVSESHRLECHAYCLMHNHYHLVATTPLPNLSAAMQQLNGPYGHWWNRQRGRIGHVFQGRFHAQLIQHDRYLLTACRYVVLNPVRAGIAGSPDAWPWSSYRAMAGLADLPPFLRDTLVLRMLGGSSTDAARARFRDFVSEPGGEPHRLSSQPILGDEEYCERFKAMRGQADAEVPRRDRFTPPPLDELFSGVATRRARDAQLVLALRLGHSATAIAKHLQLHRSSVSKIVGRAKSGT